MLPVFSLSLRRVFAVGAALAIGCSAAGSVQAASRSTALPADVRQLLDDLRTIRAGSTVTDDEKAALAADLTALASGLVKPSSSSVDQLADDLAAAASGGQLTHKVESLLADDLSALLNSANLDPARLGSVLAEVRTILVASGVNAADLQQLAADLETIIDASQTDSVTTQQAAVLLPQNLERYLLMTYAGGARLATVRTEGQTTQTVLTVDVLGLPPANPYTVSVTKRSDGSVLVLGTLKVTVGLGFLSATGVKSTGAASPLAEILSSGEAVFGGPMGQTLPDGFDATDIDTLSVTDSNGVERLAGSFSDTDNLQSSSRLVNWRVDAGAADPSAAGSVSFRVKTTGVKTHDAFLLYVSGLPASAAVTLVADGAAVGTFTTTAQGRLVIAEGPVPVPTKASGRMLPVNALPAAVDLSTLSTLVLTDATGNVLANAGM